MRSRASLAVMAMSRFQSENIRKMPALSERDVEFIIEIPGKVESASSTGRVIWRSTSCGVDPG